MASSGSGYNQSRKQASAVSSGGGSSSPLLPDEMIMEILLRLPVKPILRFRAVCRSWAALFSTEEFCRLHMATAKTRPQKLLFVSPRAARSGCSTTEVYSRCCSPASGSAPDEEDELLFIIDSACGNTMQILTQASCHGLTLLHDAVARAYYICNASTRAVTRLPPCVDVDGDFEVYSHISTGLGFDGRTRRYKVVRLISETSSHGDEMTRCEVYTHGGDHGDRCWRPPTGEEVPLGLRMYAGSAVVNSAQNKVPPVFSNGFLHWLVNPSRFLKAPSVAIISFSLADEVFSSVSSPPFWTSQEFNRVLGENLVEMDNQLWMVREFPFTLEIWKLPDCGSFNDWSMKHCIDLLECPTIDLFYPVVVRVVGSTGNDSSGKKKIIIATSSHMFSKIFQKKVHTYDLNSQAVETILILNETHTSSRIPSSRFSLFEESLACIN